MTLLPPPPLPVQEFQEVLAELAKDKSMDAFRGEYEKLFNILEKSNRNEKRLRSLTPPNSFLRINISCIILPISKK
jgi:hypothetical protein